MLCSLLTVFGDSFSEVCLSLLADAFKKRLDPEKLVKVVLGAALINGCHDYQLLKSIQDFILSQDDRVGSWSHSVTNRLQFLSK